MLVRRRHKGVTHSITASHADAWHDQRSFYGAQSEVQSLFANRGARMPGTGSGGTLVHIVSGGQGCGATPARARIQASVRQRGKVDSMSMSHVQAGGQATKHGMLTAQVVVRREREERMMSKMSGGRSFERPPQSKLSSVSSMARSRASASGRGPESSAGGAGAAFGAGGAGRASDGS